MATVVDQPVSKREKRATAKRAWAVGLVLLGLLINALWLIALVVGVARIVGWFTGLL